jgi:hypothetical protein
MFGFSATNARLQLSGSKAYSSRDYEHMNHKADRGERIGRGEEIWKGNKKIKMDGANGLL